MIRAYWHKCDNFGDALTPYIIEKVTGQTPIYAETSDSPLYMVTGSILAAQPLNAVVWGCGVAFKNDIIPGRFRPEGPDFKIIATRGPLTLRMVQDCGHNTKLYGDPGLLLPYWFRPNVTQKHKLGIIPSWVDYDQAVAHYGSDAKVINVIAPVEQVIVQMLECERIVAGCLHGLVAAVAYGIPTVWAKFSNKIMGDGTKFCDFLLSLGLSCYDPINLTQKGDSLASYTFKHPIWLDLEALYQACPFKP